MEDRVERIASASTAYALQLEGVGRVFGALAAVADVTFDVKAGERRAVLGANGAGKTTLFNLITGDFAPTSGAIRFFGEDVTRLKPHERIRRGLRRTYQSSLLFKNLSVRDNIYLSVRGATKGRYSMRRLPPGDPTNVETDRLVHAVHLDSIANELVGSLSHGQQRQLEIGMALSGAPRFLLLDEPAAGLSPRERAELIQILKILPAHIGYIIIEHDLDVALRVSESVTVMHNGRVFKHGTPDAIEADPDVQRIYLGGKHG
jgi:branched-chain amino acid transport system ATP-binding protein